MALPAAPVLAISGNPYALFETEVVYIVPTIAVPTAPTLSELNAGKNVTKHITSQAGFDLSVAEVSVPRAGQNFTGSVPGRQTASASSLTFINSDAGPTGDVRSMATLGLNSTGYVVFFTEGVITAGTMDVWPYRVSSVSPSRDLEALGTTVVSFSIPSAPALFVTIPTS